MVFYSPSNVLRLFIGGCNAQAVINEELLWSVGVLEYWSIGVLERLSKPKRILPPIFHNSITPVLHYSDVVKVFIIPRFSAKRIEIYLECWSLGVRDGRGGRDGQ
jgi:hypothetical protein